MLLSNQFISQEKNCLSNRIPAHGIVTKNVYTTLSGGDEMEIV